MKLCSLIVEALYPATKSIMTIYSFSSIGLLIICLTTGLLVTVVSGSYRGNGARPRGLLASTVSGESGSLFGNRYDRTDAAARATQVESCAVSGAHEVCHTAKLESGFPVHVCPKDGKIVASLLEI